MVLDKDIEHVLKMRWQHHAGRDIPFDVAWEHLLGYIELYPYYIGLRFHSTLIEGIRGKFIMWRDPRDIGQLRQTLERKISRRHFLLSAFSRVKRSFHTYRRIGEYWGTLPVKKLPNRDLAASLDQYYKKFRYIAEGVSTLIELTSAYGQFLQKKYRHLDEQSLTFLSTPIRKTTPLREEEDFLRLLTYVGRAGLRSRKAKTLVGRHFAAYRWLSVYLGNKPWDWQTFLARVKRGLQDGDYATRLHRIESQSEVNELNVSAIAKNLKISASDVRLLREMIFYRIEHENAFSFMTFSASGLIAEAAKRLGLATTDYRFLKPEEVRSALRNELRSLPALIRPRKKHFVIAMGKKSRHLFVGKAADTFLKQLTYVKLKATRSKQQGHVIRGICGSRGFARGKVRIVLEIDDIDTVKSGEILVTQNTTPTFVPAMKKSAAIITDEGGITCHAAIVARELGIPCVIGTKVATKVFKDGDLVEVDATKGLVRKIK